MLGFLSGLLAFNAGEWIVHKQLSHELARDKNSIFHYHLSEHHKNTMQGNYIDKDYTKGLFEEWNAYTKEAAGLFATAVAITPLFAIAPGFIAGTWVGFINYYFVHKKAHNDPEWAYKYLPWHYEHHMGPNIDANYCITFPLWDYVMGTRERYIGTEKEKKDKERRDKKAATA